MKCASELSLSFVLPLCCFGASDAHTSVAMLVLLLPVYYELQLRNDVQWHDIHTDLSFG
jgi:hypothetical protein